VNIIDGFDISAPEDVGLAKARIDGIAAGMRELVDSARRAGVVSAIACRGKLVHFQAYGWRDLESDLPMETGSLFRLFSMTRSITAVGLLTLVDEGRLELNTPVARYLPEFADTPVIAEIKAGEIVTVPQSTPLTVHHLLAYTGGFGYPLSYPDAFGLTMDQVLPVNGTLEAGIKRLAEVPLLAQPGARWRYGFSGDVTARLAEVVSRQTYDVFLSERVFQPLNMNNTGFAVRAERKNDLAQIYSSGPDATLLNSTARAPVTNSYEPGNRLFSGGGGLVSTAGDYLTFCQMLLNGGVFNGARILTAESVANMLRNHLTPDQGPLMWSAPGRGTEGDIWAAHDGYGWGLGISVRLDDEQQNIPGGRGECRWDGLANTSYFIDPEHEIVAVAMSQFLALDGRELELVIRNNLYD
jgi:CubicO group peptidase (beta-lactamase class C family)